MSYVPGGTLYPDCSFVGQDCGFSIEPNSTIAFVGDSWTAGNHFVQPLYYSINATFPFAGAGYVPVDSYQNNWSLNYYPTDPLFSFFLDPVNDDPAIYSVTRTTSGTWTDTVKFGYGPNLMSTNSYEIGATKTVTSTATDFTIYYFKQPGGGSFNYSIDSGPPIRVDTASASSALGTILVSGQALANHTVSMTVNATGQKGVTLLGVDFSVSDSGGIKIDKLGMSGANSGNGWGLANNTLWRSEIAQLSPEVVVINLGTNDITAFSIEKYITGITNIANNIKAADPSIEIVLAPPAVGPAMGPAGDVSAYFPALQELALQNGYGYLEVSGFFGSYNEALANGLWVGNNSPHLSITGDQLYADILLDYLGLANTPVITSVAGLNQQNIAGGGLITINGEHFFDGAIVTIGGKTVTGVTFISSEIILVCAPANAEGVADVEVTNYIRTATFHDGVTYLDVDLLTLIAAVVQGSELKLYYNETLDAVNKPDSGMFSVQLDGSSLVGVNAIGISGNVVTLSLESSVAPDDMVTVSYTDQGAADDIYALQNTVGKDAPGFTGYLAYTSGIPATHDLWLPVSQVGQIAAMSEITAGSAQFLVRWSGSDTGSGIATYTVCVSDNGGDYTAWLDLTTGIEALYFGERGHTYSFYTIATDNDRNLEAAPSVADLVVHVDADAVLSDTASPQINEVVLPASREYVAGESLDFTVRFSETVVVDVTGLPPVIRVTIGSSEVDALYQSGSGSDSILFRYVIAEGESDSDGIALGGEIVTNGAAIRDIAGNLIADFTFIAGATDGIRIDLPPTLTSFSAPVEQTTRNKQVAISLAELLAKGDEADADGTVDAVVIESVTGGSLKIGADAASATAYDVLTNNTVDALHQAFWTPALDTYGFLDAFRAVVKDNAGIASATPVQVKVDVLASMVGSTGNDQQNGAGGDDQMYGEAGNDTLVGNGGNDLLDGGSGVDRMEGGSGNDVYVVDNPGDVVKEITGNGTDSVESSITWTLGANVENLTLTGSGAINGKGNVLDNVITGNGGANVLNGATGNDTIDGGGGNDTINGGTGVDVMTGGVGNDLFLFDYLATTESGVVATSHDIITDFVSGMDRLDLSAIDANVRVSGNQVFDSALLLAMNPFTAAGQLRFDGATGMLYGNTDNNLLTAEFTIQLTGVSSLAVGDLVL